MEDKNGNSERCAPRAAASGWLKRLVQRVGTRLRSEAKGQRAPGKPAPATEAANVVCLPTGAAQSKQAVGAQSGIVYLVGAGPGDPELLTLRAARLLREADVVVYDNLVGEGVLELVRRDAKRIYVGKQAGNHSLPQPEINVLLVRLARQGKKVVRLKGGDPYIFGRGGEEVESLVECAIPFEVTPGVTAASGVASYAGIPLTHRDYAQACIFVTGHLKDGSINLDWPALARARQTVVIYMGIGALPEISRQLIANGLSADTPAAVVRNATTPMQCTVAGTLASLPQLVAASSIKAPGLIIIGEVVRLQKRLQWFAPLDKTERHPAQGGPHSG